MTTPRRALVALIISASIASALAAAAADREVEASTCDLDAVVANVRAGIKTGSPAYRRYLAALLKEAAAGWPTEALVQAFTAEVDPAMVEVLGAALASRSDRSLDPSALHAVASRAEGDADPEIRAAAVRALRRTSTLENTQDLYRNLMADPSPAVREEAATNLVEDNRLIYSGHDGPAADTAIDAAAQAADTAAAASVVRGISTEAISPESTRTLVRLLGGADPELRAAAAGALGGVPASEKSGAATALLDAFDRETALEVRVAIVEALVRLEFAGSLPHLARLRAADPRLAGEIDAWRKVLALGLQEWSLMVREKERLTAGR